MISVEEFTRLDVMQRRDDRNYLTLTVLSQQAVLQELEPKTAEKMTDEQVDKAVASLESLHISEEPPTTEHDSTAQAGHSFHLSKRGAFLHYASNPCLSLADKQSKTGF